jgi:hypothetical protein
MWTHAFHSVYLVVNCCKVWYDDEAYWFLSIGGTLILLFTVFNVFGCLIPTYQRWVKFALKTEEFKALPSDINERSRRKSIVELEKAANDVLVDFQVGKDVMELCGSSKGVERRHTIPPQRSSGRRSSAAILLRASVANVSSILAKMDYLVVYSVYVHCHFLFFHLKHSITAGTRITQYWKDLEAKSYLEKKTYV